MKKEFITRQEQRQPLRQLYIWLKSLQSTIIFMQTGAHPDDETSRLLSRLSLGDGMHVIYVNAVRGQGGQNSLGPERGDALGYLRTEELYEAMRILRADIGWLSETPVDPIRDFGFSKSAEQTYDHWGENYTLMKMVKMVRFFKPDILIPTFLDVPGQHGHHRAVTRTTIAAFEDAADATKFNDETGLPAWQVNALYLPAWSGGGGSYDDEVPPPKMTHSVLTGAYDPVLGGTYAQVGEWSRACHATQGMGSYVDEEERPVPLHQLRTASGTRFLDQLTQNIPEKLVDLANYCRDDRGRKAANIAQEAADSALKAFPDVEVVIENLCQLQAALKQLETSIEATHLHRINLKLRQTAMAASEAAALQLSFKIIPDVPAIGSSAEACLSWHVTNPEAPPSITARLVAPDQLKCGSFSKNDAEGRRQSIKAPIKILPPLLDPMKGWHGIMNYPCGLYAELTLNIGASEFVLTICPEAVFSTKPAHTGRVVTSQMLIYDNCCRQVGVEIYLNDAMANAEKVSLFTPKGWHFKESVAQVASKISGTLAVPNSERSGHYRIEAKIDDEPLYSIRELSFPHIRKQEYFFPAKADIAVVNTASLQGLNIGWIDGGVDNAHSWARQLGANVIMLENEDLQSGAFQELDVIVAGVFAAGSRPINSSMHHIRNWIKKGGHFVSQYHRSIDNWDKMYSSPLPLQPGSPSIRWRVTDPTATVIIMKPDHQIFNNVNQITQKDFDGWVKERGLYFASEWDDAYVSLLAMSDGDEPLLKGGLLAAKIGSGCHIHCALNLFYQMDNMVIGAYRLFANLLTPHKGK